MDEDENDNKFKNFRIKQHKSRISGNEFHRRQSKQVVPAKPLPKPEVSFLYIHITCILIVLKRIL